MARLPTIYSGFARSLSVSSSRIFAAEALLERSRYGRTFCPQRQRARTAAHYANPYLNNLLLKYCEAAITDRRGNVSQLRTRVENAISSLLPHGRVVVDHVARSLGMSKRSLARRLSDEGLNFTEVLQQLRRDLAVRYLDDPKLQISKIAWLLGFNEVSAFTHAFKRWTGKTPSQMRIGRAGATQDRWPLPHLRWPAQAVNVEGR